MTLVRTISIALLLFLPGLQAQAAECAESSSRPEWIFCDDFESSSPLVGSGRYFEVSDDEGDFVVAEGAGLNGSRAIRALWQPGEDAAGSLKLGFGRNPVAYMNKGIRSTEDFREIYYRMYLKLSSNWQGAPSKLSRATVFASPDHWGQAMVAHLWTGSDPVLNLDPVSCVNASGSVECTTYNDFAHFQWLGAKPGTTPLFDGEHNNEWICIETHVKLNDPGIGNGVFQFWINGSLEARKENLNFVGSYRDYGINAVLFENFWNDGSPITQERWFDNIVVSEERIGCLDAGEDTTPPAPPLNLRQEK